MSELVDYYANLQVSPDAEPEVIEKAYKALMLKYHPDRGGDEEKTKNITAAYYVLKDESRRREYDQARLARKSDQESGPAWTRPEDIPQEVLDEIIFQHWKRGAARSASRAVGTAAAVAGRTAKVAGAVAEEVWESREAVGRKAGGFVIGGLGLAFLVLAGSGLAMLWLFVLPVYLWNGEGWGCLPTLLLTWGLPFAIFVIYLISDGRQTQRQQPNSEHVHERQRQRQRDEADSELAAWQFVSPDADLYAALGVHPKALRAELEAGHREARESGSGGNWTEMVDEAYDILSDPVRRRRYDAWREGSR